MFNCGRDDYNYKIKVKMLFIFGYVGGKIWDFFNRCLLNWVIGMDVNLFFIKIINCVNKV